MPMNSTSRKNWSRWLGLTALECSSRESSTMHQEERNSTHDEAIEVFVLYVSKFAQRANRSVLEMA
ncbi:hypothetical protein SLS55_000819 [Diplodia seriata]|uniref:Uncharacterized protein n=1 Tax=Diplodia seriata TaxID=420778 RepID=A0ABR3CVF1_9PEZI